MKITMVGTGYVGLVTGACLANLGHDVLCLDIDEDKIKRLEQGEIPIYEPGLPDLVEKNVHQERLKFTTDSKKAVQFADVIFIAVGTPRSSDSGNADLTAVWKVAKTVAEHMERYKVIVDKSTVPVGTADKVKGIISSKLEKLGKDLEFDVVSNPEFLREGAAVKDFQNPDRVVVGVENPKAQKFMELIYKDVARVGRPIMFTDVKSAEIIKYASNAMLSTRISFMNQLSHLCDKVGADIKEVAKGIGLDSRIGPRFLQAGLGYGGSCFPKDVLALSSTLKENNCPSELFDAVHDINDRQKLVAVDKLKSMIDVKGKIIALWGLAFKPRTDDMREASSIVIAKELKKLGAKVKAYDPVAMENAKKEIDNIEFAKDEYDVLKDADALILVTEWDEFRNPDFEKVKSLLSKPILIDGRNIYDPLYLKDLGFRYEGIGRQ